MGVIVPGAVAVGAFAAIAASTIGSYARARTTGRFQLDPLRRAPALFGIACILTGVISLILPVLLGRRGWDAGIATMTIVLAILLPLVCLEQRGGLRITASDIVFRRYHRTRVHPISSLTACTVTEGEDGQRIELHFASPTGTDALDVTEFHPRSEMLRLIEERSRVKPGLPLKPAGEIAALVFGVALDALASFILGLGVHIGIGSP